MSRIVTFGEIMARLATPGFKRFQQTMPGTLEVTFAGAEASIAASIAYLGGDASFATALPDNGLADACVADLRSMGVCTRNILRTAGGRLGLYFLETGANQRPGVVIYDREGSSVAITPPSTYNWSAIFEGAEWFVISGITPAISRNATEVISEDWNQPRCWSVASMYASAGKRSSFRRRKTASCETPESIQTSSVSLRRVVP